MLPGGSEIVDAFLGKVLLDYLSSINMAVRSGALMFFFGRGGKCVRPFTPVRSRSSYISTRSNQ